MAKRVGSPLGVALVAAVLVGLVAALVLSFVLDDEPEDAVPVITLDPNVTQPTLTAPPNSSVGAAAPNFSFQTFDGDEVDFDQLRDGRPALINFFAHWCAPCIVEMPHLEEVHQEFGDEVAFVGLAEGSSSQAMDLVEQTGVTYVTGTDDGGDVLTAYEGSGLPMTVFVTADGQISGIYTRKLQLDEMQQELEALVT